ncbi:MAG: hypothetical protein LBQ54_13860 [Planctomycetaceae bacterium]|jgi:hypothetical protein|nr:hypothetical protein [Planctomycetaceae bacterium]
MTFKPFRALLWKEFRQQYLLWLGLFFLSLILHVLTGLYSVFEPNQVHIEGEMFVLTSVVITLLYLMASTSLIFSNEKEERTYTFLRRLPITPEKIVLSKLGWVFGSTLWIAFCLGTLSLVSYVIVTPSEFLRYFSHLTNTDINRTDELNQIADGCLIFAVVSAEAFCWGLFWSTRIRSQMYSFLLTAGSLITTLILSIFFGSWIDRHLHILTEVEHTVFFTFSHGLVILVTGGIGFWDAWKWITRKENAPAFREIEPITKAEKIRLLTTPPSGEMRWLFWQTFRQSRVMLLSAFGLGLLVYFFGLGTALNNIPAGREVFHFSDSRFFKITVSILGILCYTMPFLFCGSVFWADQKNNGRQMLCYRGISPGKIWWSRILPFGAVYFWFPAAVLATCAVFFLFFNPNSRIFLYHPSDLIVFWHLFLGILYFFLAYSAVFCIGQLVSLLSKSVVLSAFGTFGAALLFLCWMSTVMVYLNLSLLWTALPLELMMLYATWRRMPDWLRGRNTFRAYLRAMSPVLATGAVVLTAIPLVRVYSVPVIDKGFALPVSVIEKAGPETTERNDRTVAELLRVIEENSGSDNIESMKTAWLTLQDLLKDPQFATHYNISLFTEYHIYRSIIYRKPRFSEESLREAAAFLELIPSRRATLSEILARNYTALEIDVRNHVYTINDTMRGFRLPPPNYEIEEHWLIPDLERREFNAGGMQEVPISMRILFFWEKYRVMRRLNYVFQIESEAVTQLERKIQSGVLEKDSVEEILVRRKQQLRRHSRLVRFISRKVPFLIPDLETAWDYNAYERFYFTNPDKEDYYRFALDLEQIRKRAASPQPGSPGGQ